MTAAERNDGIDFPGYGTKPSVQRLSIHMFDSVAGMWREAKETQTASHRTHLSFATFNAWFQGPDANARHEGLVSVLQEADADVILLQEVTEALLGALTRAQWVRAAYRFVRAPFKADAIPSHGLMLLSRLPLAEPTLHPLPTSMGRRLLTAAIELAAMRLVVATVHLESMKSHAETRAEQLRVIFSLLEGEPNVVLGGDFNFCSSVIAENARLDPRYVDIWPRLRPGEPGYTQDTDANPMLARAKRETKRVRIDRLLLRSDAADWQPESIRLLGAKPFNAKYPKLFASDHFGVGATIHSRHGS